MGPKGERGQPGSIVWNGIKVNKIFLFPEKYNIYTVVFLIG
jgi:hypothetical protein